MILTAKEPRFHACAVKIKPLSSATVDLIQGVGMLWSTSGSRRQAQAAEATLPISGNLGYFDEKQNPATGT